MKSIEVVAAIIVDGEKIFITQRGYGKYKDKWEFPGGKVEQGEERMQALKREIREELDTEIDIDRLLTTVEYDYPDFHLILHCYICHVKCGGLTLLEHEAAKWVTPAEISDYDWLPADWQVLDALRNRIN